MRVFYTRHLLLTCTLALSACGLMAQNAYLANLSIPRYIKAGVNYPIAVHARNLSSTPYTNFSVSWRLDGGATVTGPNQGVGGGGIVTNNYLNYTHPTQMNTTQGPHTLEVWINTTVDTDPNNNKITMQFTALSNWAEKVVLLEGRTETWCQYCPTANTVTNTLASNPDFAVVKFHLSDALDQCTECVDYYDQYNITFTPAGMIDMGEYGGYTINSQSNTWESSLTARAAGVSPAALTMTSSVNTTTRLLTVTLTAEFTYSFAGPFHLNVYVAEDNVLGPQTNGGAGSNYVHNRVMRAMLGGSEGTTGVVPNTPVVGTDYTRTYTWTVPAGYNISNLDLVGVLEHQPTTFGNRYTVNAVNRSVAGVGIDDLSLGNNSLEAYPNPFTDRINVHVADAVGNATMELIGMDGRIVLQETLVLNSTVASTVDLPTSLPEGAYVLRIRTAEGVAEQRVIKMN